ncbi:hypothetical protein COCCADRAFT_27625 [Bipolaris zeicola 26-R-13]|uniref:SMP domain-containing protein n=1 Tax=Cochliobolus carbonum (strain 26-R-13) TaxID=930089 RepID=W6Y1E8_COCC2|nr:uncharacterized protein COCCADRAFT_27625 [Bipolaris zeicola 26-R-13]EUC31728.1 hypothetical protein COCCADRAFT_27625 [Bipolaris zeicola 26-R-13]
MAVVVGGVRNVAGSMVAPPQAPANSVPVHSCKAAAAAATAADSDTYAIANQPGGTGRASMVAARVANPQGTEVATKRAAKDGERPGEWKGRHHHGHQRQLH